MHKNTLELVYQEEKFNFAEICFDKKWNKCVCIIGVDDKNNKAGVIYMQLWITQKYNFGVDPYHIYALCAFF